MNDVELNVIKLFAAKKRARLDDWWCLARDDAHNINLVARAAASPEAEPETDEQRITCFAVLLVSMELQCRETEATINKELEAEK